MKNIAFLFPGQGAQYIGMSKNLCENFSLAENTFEEANEVLDYDIKRLCFEGDIGFLTDTRNAQPAILTASVAAYRVYMNEIGIDAKISCGHSLGEISALCCGGAIDFKTALKLISKRAEYMSEAQPVGSGAMAAVGGVDNDTIKRICSEVNTPNNVVVCASFNSPDQIVISGTKKAVNICGTKLKEAGAFFIPLKVSGAFHSPLMKSAAEKFEQELKKIEFKPLGRTVISNLTAQPYKESDYVENLTKQIVSPVRFVETLNYIKYKGIDLIIEMGPKQILKGLCSKTIPDVKALSFDVETDFDAVKLELLDSKNVDYDGNLFLRICVCDAVSTKNSNFNEEEYQKGVVQNYRKLVELRTKFENNQDQPTIIDLKQAFGYLSDIFNTKMITNTEQKMFFDELFLKTNTKGLF